jgi:hypothetical protein
VPAGVVFRRWCGPRAGATPVTSTERAAYSRFDLGREPCLALHRLTRRPSPKCALFVTPPHRAEQQTEKRVLLSRLWIRVARSHAL